MLTPQPDTTYDKNPPTAVRQMNTEDVPIASIIEKPISAVRMAIKNIPPPTPKRPDENPTKRPIIAVDTQLNDILASSLSLLMSVKFLIAMKSNKHPNIISKTLDDNPEATKPPIAPPIIPKIPNRIPGFKILSVERECL